MNDQIEIDLYERPVIFSKEVVIKIQALWRGYLTRKHLRRVQALYSQIFEELEESPNVVPYWPPETYKKPAFLCQSEYTARKNEDEKRKLEQASKAERSRSAGIYRNETENSVNEESKPTGETKNNKPFNTSDSGHSTNGIIARNEAIHGELVKNTEITHVKTGKSDVVPITSNTSPDGDVVVCASNEDLVNTHVRSAKCTAGISERTTVCKDSNSSEQSDKTAELNEVEDTLMVQSEQKGNTSELKVTEKPDNNRDVQEDKAVNEGEIKQPSSGTEPLTKTVLVSETKTPEDIEQEPTRHSGGKEGLDNTLSHPLQQTSYWESEKSETSEDFDLSGMSPEELKKQRSMLGMELLWVQQAIESRKQYLQLKADIST